MPSLATAPHVVIAGAGPAGNAAASLLREGGAIVTLIEREIAGVVAPGRRGSVVVGREAWDLLRRVGGGSLLEDSRNVVSESERLMSLPSLDAALGAEAARRGAPTMYGTAVDGVTELANGRGVSVAIRDARTGVTSNLEADWFINASGGELDLPEQFRRVTASGPYSLLPERRGFLATRASAIADRPVGWSGSDGSFVINDRVEGILTAYRPITTNGPTSARPTAATGEQLLDMVGVPSESIISQPWTFTARQSLAPRAAEGRILLAGDSAGTVLPVTQAGTMLALTDAERAAQAVLAAHAADSTGAANDIIRGYDELTRSMHRAFLR